MGKLPSTLATLAPRRVTTCLLSTTTTTRTAAASPSSQLSQVRHASFIPRPRRPYTFTQLIQLSDGSTYTARTTSPQPIYRSGKDTRNTLLWQPSEKSLRNVELDEAGKLAAFRERFGRGYDASSSAGEGEDAAASDAGSQARDTDFADLITGYAPAENSAALKDSGPKKAPTRRK